MWVRGIVKLVKKFFNPRETLRCSSKGKKTFFSEFCHLQDKKEQKVSEKTRKETNIRKVGLIMKIIFKNRYKGLPSLFPYSFLFLKER